jgi:maleylpyruvate isomerase
MRLHNYWRSSCSWRVRIALHLKGLAFEYVPVHLVKDGGAQHSESYRALNPLRTVPTLEFEHAGRVHHLSQSLAILEYLEERYPLPALLPADALGRAHARMLAEVVNSGIQPLQNLMVTQRVKAELHGDDRAWNAHWIDRGLGALQALAERTAGRYLVGDAVSFADICLVPQLYSARRFGVDLGPYGLLTRVETACAGLAAFQAAHADRQPDAVPA